MGLKQSKPLSNKSLAEIKDNTNLSPRQIRDLWDRFNELDLRGDGQLQLEDFEKIPEMRINPLRKRITNLFMNQPSEPGEPKVRGIVEYGDRTSVNFYQFCTFLDTFQKESRSTKNVEFTYELSDEVIDQLKLTNRKRAKLELLFGIFDTDGSNSICQSELRTLLESMVDQQSVMRDSKKLDILAGKALREVSKGAEFMDFENFAVAMQNIDIDEKLLVKI